MESKFKFSEDKYLSTCDKLLNGFFLEVPNYLTHD
jgi:hypothetical protein